MFNKNIYFLFLFLLVLSGCEEKTYDPVLVLGAVPVITSPAADAAFVLEETESENIITTFEWTKADFGYQAGISYTLEMDAVGNNFATPITLGTVDGVSITDVTIGRVNAALLAAGYAFGVASELELRVCASVSDEVQSLCSEPVKITINPYLFEIIYPKLTVPGDYQGWAPEDENFAVYSRKGDEVYEGYIYFPNETAVYKFAQGLSWDVNWGDIEPDGILDPGGVGNDIPINDGKGMYQLNCDLNTLTHSNLKTDWGILGDATPTGWDSDTDMIWDADRNVLTITMDLNAGVIKFRANDAWDLNYGDDSTNGFLEVNGADIPIETAGNYTIDLIINVADYTYSVTKN